MPHRSWRRRTLLAGTATALLGACADTNAPRVPQQWGAGPGEPPVPVQPGPFVFFTRAEAATVDALVERLIPSDALGPGAREAGVTTFIDRQLAGDYGSSARLYMRPPFAEGTPQQGLQSARTPAQQYRAALAAIDRYAASAYAGQPLGALPPETRDRLLTSLESGQVPLENADGRTFFELLLRNTMEGFFADPIYGGNRDMAGWKLVGFPGARYDYRDHIALHDTPYPLPPVGLKGRAAWTL